MKLIALEKELETLIQKKIKKIALTRIPQMHNPQKIAALRENYEPSFHLKLNVTCRTFDMNGDILGIS